MKIGDSAKEAHNLITGDRAAQYGSALADFSRTATLFKMLSGVELEPWQVCLLMCCVKLSREVNRHKEDNLVDLIGYADILNHLRSTEF